MFTDRLDATAVEITSFALRSSFHAPIFAGMPHAAAPALNTNQETPDLPRQFYMSPIRYAPYPMNMRSL
jgi:hypothetical protein